MKINIPTSWSEVTVRQFIELSKVPELGFDEVDTQFKILSILTGVEDDVFINMELPELKKAIKITTFTKSQPANSKIRQYVKIKGVKYSIQYEANKLLAGEYIDLQNYIKGGVNNNLHNVIAVYLKPVNFFGFRKIGCYEKNSKRKWIQTLESRNETAEAILDGLTMDLVFAMSGFFLRLYQRLILRTQLYLEVQNHKAMKSLKKELAKAGLPTHTVGI